MADSQKEKLSCIDDQISEKADQQVSQVEKPAKPASPSPFLAETLPERFNTRDYCLVLEFTPRTEDGMLPERLHPWTSKV